MSKPKLLHLGDDVRWNHELYQTLQKRFQIERSYSMDRDEFKLALQQNRFGQFVAMYRPFWNTGGEMGNWDAELISLLPASCKIFTSAGAGFDWVDTKELARRGIIYCNSAAACTESVADTFIYLMLSTFRRFSWSSLAARSQDPAKFEDAYRNIAAITHNPNGHTLGIIGLGRIGYRIAQKAHQSFGMKILYHDIRRQPTEVEKTVDAQFFEVLGDMLSISDCVVLATPFSGELVMTAPIFASMKKGSRFVNIARGKLVDEEALVAELEKGNIFAAGLDVHYNEPNVHPKLAAMSNVELLCHNAGASIESHIGFERLGIENVLAFFRTGQALTAVNAHLVARLKL